MSPLPRRTPWGMVGLFVAAGIVAAFHVGKVPPALPSIRSELGATLGQAGWLLSTVNLVTALGGMAIALTADRFGERRLVVLGTVLAAAASLLGAVSGSVPVLLAWRVVEGLAFIMVVVAIPPLILRIASPADQRTVMTLWSAYMPTGAGTMMLLGAVVLPALSWRVAWIVAAAASGIVLAILLARTLGRRELDAGPAERLPVLGQMREVATSSGPLAIAVCFGAYSVCWFTVVGFLPTLQVERLHFSTSAAAVVTAIVVFVNAAGNLGGGWLIQRGMPRVAVIVGATVPMAFCVAGIFLDGLPDIVRLVLAGVYSAVIGVVPAAMFTAIPVHAPRPRLAGAATGLLMQGSNIGALLGPPIAAMLVAAHGWPSAIWLTSVSLTAVTLSGVFLHWRERRKITR